VIDKELQNIDNLPKAVQGVRDIVLKKSEELGLR
jgi:hypothetical protein